MMMDKDVTAVIFSNMHENRIAELTAHRCMGSIPVGGRYRVIDFVLSSLANAGIQSVGVVTKNNYQSLMDHLGNGREWDLSRKRGGLIILPPFGNVQSGGMYRGRVEAFYNISSYLDRIPAKYVIAADCDIMANIDYADFVSKHVESGADMTLMYKVMPVSGESDGEHVTLTLDHNDNIRDMMIGPSIKGEQNVYMNNIIIGKELLKRLVFDAFSHNRFIFESDILQAGIGKYKIRGYEFKSYVGRFDSMKTYYHENLALLDPLVREQLFPADRPVYTKVKDDAPVKYGLDARVSNSLIADGCIVHGEVEGSILFRGVKVERGAKIKNSIIMQGTCVAAGSSLEYIICDKAVTIREKRVLSGFDSYPVYVSKGAVV